MIVPSQYLQQRIDDQIIWYDGKSSHAQMRYKTLRLSSIVISLSIPILTGMIGGAHDAAFKLIISVEAASVALIEGILSLYKYKDNWTGYRATSESLKYHRFLFEAGAAPYDASNAFQVFVQNAEGLMADERVAWVQTNKAIPDSKPLADATGEAAQPDDASTNQPQADAQDSQPAITTDNSQQLASAIPASQATAIPATIATEDTDDTDGADETEDTDAGGANPAN